MENIDITKLSNSYTVRKLNLSDAETIYSFCKKNTQYYEYCGKELSYELINNDLEITPPGIPPEQKHYVGFFKNSQLAAVMDLIAGYPDVSCAYIGFFMMDFNLQGHGEGSRIVSEVFAYLQNCGFEKCQLGIDKDNPQSNHFWRKNGFEIVREVSFDEGTILVAEKKLTRPL